MRWGRVWGVKRQILKLARRQELGEPNAEAAEWPVSGVERESQWPFKVHNEYKRGKRNPKRMAYSFPSYRGGRLFETSTIHVSIDIEH